MSKQPRTKISNHIAELTLSKGSTKNVGKRVAAYLLSENRVGELDSILRDVQAAWAEAGYVEVIARSAHPLTASIKKEINDRVKKVYPAAKEIIVTEQTDPDVIGGVKLELPNKQLDLTVEAKLNKFKQLTNA